MGRSRSPNLQQEGLALAEIGIYTACVTTNAAKANRLIAAFAAELIAITALVAAVMAEIVGLLVPIL